MAEAISLLGQQSKQHEIKTTRSIKNSCFLTACPPIEVVCAIDAVEDKKILRSRH